MSAEVRLVVALGSGRDMGDPALAADQAVANALAGVSIQSLDPEARIFLTLGLPEPDALDPTWTPKTPFGTVSVQSSPGGLTLTSGEIMVAAALEVFVPRRT
ncbi:MAG: Lin0512 family protein [Pseudomonadota bacterium]